MTSLHETLRGAGQAAVDLGGVALVLPFGGRVLALCPRPDVNAFWVNPALEDATTARALLNDPGWINLGGDRTWLSPEVETHIVDPARGASTSRVPTSVDPAAYAITARDERSVRLETHIRVDFMRTSATLDLVLEKTVQLLDRPPVAVAPDVAWAGYSLRCRLEADALPAAAHPALWHLIQVRGGGQIRIALRPNARPRAYFGNPVHALENGAFVCDVSTASSFKVSFRADDCVGLLTYAALDAPTPHLVVRRHRLAAKERYRDAPYDDLSDTGHAEQVYVDNGAMGGFGEIEYHSPGMDRSDRGVLEDESSVWAFAGPAEALARLRDRIVGSPAARG